MYKINHLAKCSKMGEFNRRASRHQTNGKRKSKRAFSVRGFRQEGNIKKCINTRVQQTDTCWDTGAFTPYKNADVNTSSQ